MSEKFGPWLQGRFLEWSQKQTAQGKRIPSQAEFAKWLDVPTTSLSVWMNDVRIPSGESIDKLADKLGVEVYDKLGVPRRMPKDKKLYFLASVWAKLDQQSQDKLFEMAQNLAESKNHNHGKNTETES